MTQFERTVAVIGAGVGGLSAALSLLACGAHVTVVEAADAPGGKMRQVPGRAGPVDAGPTVMTMPDVFEQLFQNLGANLSDHVTLEPETVLARHYWPDGISLDLSPDPEISAANIAARFGPRDAAAFRRFRARAQRLFDGFRGPMLESRQPSRLDATLAVVRNPQLVIDMAPWATLAQSLERTFRDVRLRQLFGRYATYVGGNPNLAPALLSLIWRSEEAGVFRIRGGMHRLAGAMATLARHMGADLRFGTRVAEISRYCGRANGIRFEDGTFMPASAVVFNGDPRALVKGYLGTATLDAVDPAPLENRSLSANVLSFAARVSGPALAHHTVFFTRDPQMEFGPLADGHPPAAASLYICAQDRDSGKPPAPGALERFEIIENAPPFHNALAEDPATCLTRILNTLKSRNLRFFPPPDVTALATPATFAAMFPGSQGCLYGQSPHGLTAAFQRPTARTKIPGLYLAGGGAHPGAGVPMAALSGRHAGAAIARDLGLTSPSRQTGMRGGTSTEFPIADLAPSRSSPS
ncbi:MAG: phytoene desaturase [Rhodobacteraceae bacterium]|nr:phytoene desaturase [Paracoccaceae bacterium]